MKRLLVTALLSAVASVPALAGSTLSPADIQATFGTGKPFTATNMVGGKTYSFTLNSDGTAVRVSNSTKASVNGTWRVTDKGYCTKWGVATENCYTVEKSGKSYVVKNAAGKTVSKWSLPV